ncbi:alpha-mannosidase [Anaerocolumna sedimenticola]|uniref:Alpha-mannosidase n=1 Tax=Anaerocolumna sedimenticola TaxID=2696063 RepID=A0A6P1TI93_9FIRM|nr:alpha-mannosidase [Anaerocolumna sedimenticola]QHQ60930.1 alpha-mannosidase [Anaerocolumna sedimenticola]
MKENLIYPAAKYTRLKRQVGGNREKYHYEETFGQPMEEFYGITMPNAWNRRILAEIEFSIRLSKELNGKYDGILHQTLDYLLDKMNNEGALTINTCKEAEQMLLPLSGVAKEYELILAAHAHIDMNWMWGWQETVAATIATFQTMLKLMEEYPDFHFSQSQAAVYKIIEDYAPELKEKMKQRIREGRWEITASAWVETDKNMPSAESLLNHIYYTKKYLKEHWEVEEASLDIDFSPDTFGHSAHLPELDTLGGVKYYYHCRGLDGDNALYRWRSKSGKELLVYREQYWYNSGITPLPAIGLIDVAKRSGGLKTGLVVYGVGDHGGGPTRKDLERAIEMMEWPVFPQLRFGTFHDYFKAAETVRDKIPVVEQELNFIFPGCYTTQSRLKLGNRHAENGLYEAECLDAFANGILHTPYQSVQYESAWQSMLFTHFHDILTGSCVQESREHAMGLLSHSIATAGTRASFAMQALAGNIDTSGISMEEGLPVESKAYSQSEGAGAGYGITALKGIPAPEQGAGLTRIYHIFNVTACDREDNCLLTVWDYTGDLRYLYAQDTNGKEIPIQLIDTMPKTYWDHKYFRVLVKVKAPAFGFTTIVLSQKEAEEYQIYLQPSVRTNKPTENIILENKFLRAEFDFKNGSLISLNDKKTGKELLKDKERGGLRYLTTERDSSSAWQIGRYTDIQSDCFQTTKITMEKGNLRQGFTVEQTVKNSLVKTEVFLEEGARALTIHLEIDWHEVSRDKEPVPVLLYHLPLKETDNFLYDVPGGVQYRRGMQLDVPGLTFGAALDEKSSKAVFLASDCKYGYRGSEDGLSCTLINSTTNPDPYPERGIHNITLYAGICEKNPVILQTLVSRFLHPLLFQSGNVHKGTLPLTESMLKINGGLLNETQNAVVSGIFRLNRKLVVRISEICGQRAEVNLEFNQEPKKAGLIDIVGTEMDGTVTISGNTVKVSIPAYSTVMVQISGEEI